MTFKDALLVLNKNLVSKMLIPSWAMNLMERTRKVNLAFNELKVTRTGFNLLCPLWLMQQPAIYGRNGACPQKRGDKGRASRFV